MIEYYTDAIILDKEELNENDSLIYLYTEKLGKVVAKAKGLKKILSKLSAHLEPLNFVKIRLVSGRNGYFQVVDALPHNEEVKEKIKSTPEDLIKFISLAGFIKEMTFELQQDLFLWQVVKKIIETDINEKEAKLFIIKALGFDPKFAQCENCANKDIKYFNKKDHIFLCQPCVNLILKSNTPSKDLVEI